jgi:hypothetical protein
MCVFYAKFDATGQALWGRQSSVIIDNDMPGMWIDSLNNICSALRISPPFSLGGMTLNTATAAYARMDTSGHFSALRSVLAGDVYAGDKTGNYYVVGTLNDSLRIGTTTLVDSLPLYYVRSGLGGYQLTQSSALFVTKFDSSGSLLWGRVVNGTLYFLSRNMGATDGAGNLVFSAYYDAYNIDSTHVSDSFQVGGFTIHSSQTTWYPSSDVFVCKYGAAGDVVWAAGACGSTDNHLNGPSCATTDDVGNAYVAGLFNSSTLTFGMDVLGYVPTYTFPLYNENANFFVARFSPYVAAAVPEVADNGKRIRVYPNPAHSQIIVACDDMENRIVVANLLGQTVLESGSVGKDVVLDISALVPGVYAVRVNGAYCGKVVKY